MFRPLLITLFLTSTALADTWTVDDDGKADFDNIQAAVDAASDGDEIVVMPGTYTSAQDGHVVNMLGKAVWLHSSDGPEVTIIDGEGTRRGIACFNSETSETIIDGFTISNGYGVSFDYGEMGGAGWGPTAMGGGIIIIGGHPYPEGCSPTIANCIISNNVSVANGDGAYGAGGGVLTANNSGATLTNCTFENNSTNGGGGGMANWYNYPLSPSLNNCTFVNNSAIMQGGGIENNNDCPLLLDCTVCGNSPNQISGCYSDEGGNFVGATCPTPGACCTNNNCTDSLEEDCLTFFGQWQGDGTICSENPCPSTCLGDITGDGIVDVSDLLVVIGVWGACP
jgi:hypothetical protein